MRSLAIFSRHLNTATASKHNILKIFSFTLFIQVLHNMQLLFNADLEFKYVLTRTRVELSV